jgi:hypothetical protein
MDARRRTSRLLAPGDSLLLCQTVSEPLGRLTALAEDSGMTPESFICNPLAGIPLPRYRHADLVASGVSTGTVEHPGGVAKRWRGVDPSVLWLPIFWLPPHLFTRFRITDQPAADADQVQQPAIVHVEDDTLWTIRVCLELSTSGLYDPEDGTWVDVLSLVGLDSEDDLDQARLRDWLDGAEDDLLDDLDLTGFFSDDRSLAMEAACDLRADLEIASYALLANDLAALADEDLDHTKPVTGAPALHLLASLAGLGAELLRSAPDAEPGTSAGTYFESIAAGVASGEIGADDAPRYLTAVREMAFNIRDRCWPTLDALAAAEEDALGLSAAAG